ncbi:LysE family translocator [Ponticaulis profundi]|uniref:LysE family translocator n=1 Tax=Ponticaulis profundi TaxID=2665222 RepID=A0ABW1SEC8_9PROT
METFALFLGIVVLAVISPGADFAMVSRTSAVSGRTAGLMTALGVATACWFHITYAIFGLELITRWLPGFLDGVRLIGVAYLIYLGASMAWPRRRTAQAEPIADTGSTGRHFLLGLFTNALNPKTAIFVISLYAQVIGHSTGMLTKLGYGAIISAVHLLWFALVAIFLSRDTVRQFVARHRPVVDTIIGLLLIALGVALLFYKID